MTASRAAETHPADNAGPGRAFEAGDYGLYAATVFVWGTSWIALKWQVGVVAPPVSVAWRFAIAASIMLAWCVASRRRLRFPAADHLRFAAMGVCLFSVNFLLFYFAASYLVSGLLAVVFSFASILNIILAILVLGEPFRPRVFVGAVLGVAGIGLLFWPEMADQTLGGGALTGLALGLCGTLFFCVGNMVSASNQRRGIPVLSANALGMVYGTAVCIGIALATKSAFIVEPTVRYLGALAWLAILSTVVAFGAYLTLLGRIGADRAGYVTVLFPVVALAISTLLEGYRWTPIAVVGFGLVAAGNVLALTRRKRI